MGSVLETLLRRFGNMGLRRRDGSPRPAAELCTAGWSARAPNDGHARGAGPRRRIR